MLQKEGSSRGAWHYGGISQPCRDLYRAALGLVPGGLELELHFDSYLLRAYLTYD